VYSLAPSRSALLALTFLWYRLASTSDTRACLRFGVATNARSTTRPDDGASQEIDDDCATTLHALALKVVAMRYPLNRERMSELLAD